MRGGGRMSAREPNQPDQIEGTEKRVKGIEPSPKAWELDQTVSRELA